MKPKKSKCEQAQEQLLGILLERLVAKDHSLVKLAGVLEWAALENKFEECYADFGRPGEPLRLMLGFEYLKYTFDLSDEEVCSSRKESTCSSKSLFSCTAVQERATSSEKIANLSWASHTRYWSKNSRMNKNFLRGKFGDHYNAILCGVGVNIQRLRGEIYLLLNFFLQLLAKLPKERPLLPFRQPQTQILSFGM